MYKLASDGGDGAEADDTIKLVFLYEFFFSISSDELLIFCCYFHFFVLKNNDLFFKFSYAMV